MAHLIFYLITDYDNYFLRILSIIFCIVDILNMIINHITLITADMMMSNALYYRLFYLYRISFSILLDLNVDCDFSSNGNWWFFKIACHQLGWFWVLSRFLVIIWMVPLRNEYFHYLLCTYHQTLSIQYKHLFYYILFAFEHLISFDKTKRY